MNTLEGITANRMKIQNGTTVTGTTVTKKKIHKTNIYAYSEIMTVPLECLIC